MISRGQVARLDLAALAQHHRALDAVLELAHVARPVGVEQHPQRAIAKPLMILRERAGVPIEEVPRERGHVLAALAQRRRRAG